MGADRRSRRGLHQGIGLLGFPLAVLLLTMLQGGFGFTLVSFAFLIKAFFILLTLPILRFGYAVYEAKQAGATNRPRAIVATTQTLSLPKENGTALSPGRLAVTTGQPAQPQSVAEHTTRLLDKEH